MIRRTEFLNQWSKSGKVLLSFFAFLMQNQGFKCLTTFDTISNFVYYVFWWTIFTSKMTATVSVVNAAWAELSSTSPSQVEQRQRGASTWRLTNSQVWRWRSAVNWDLSWATAQHTASPCGWASSQHGGWLLRANIPERASQKMYHLF